MNHIEALITLSIKIFVMVSLLQRNHERLLRRVNDVIEGEPDASGVVMKEDRQHERHCEKNCEDRSVRFRRDNKAQEERKEYERFGRYYVDVDCANEVALLALKDHFAKRTPVAHLEKAAIHRSATAGRALEPYPSQKYSLRSRNIHSFMVTGWRMVFKLGRDE
jgi:hypothetical protein